MEFTRNNLLQLVVRERLLECFEFIDDFRLLISCSDQSSNGGDVLFKRPNVADEHAKLVAGGLQLVDELEGLQTSSDCKQNMEHEHNKKTNIEQQT